MRDERQFIDRAQMAQLFCVREVVVDRGAGEQAVKLLTFCHAHPHGTVERAVAALSGPYARVAAGDPAVLRHEQYVVDPAAHAGWVAP